MIIINSNTRQFNVPGADLVFGVSGDSGSEVKHFQCPRYVGNNLDLMSCFVRINFRNGNGKMDSYLVDDMAIDGDNVTFSWLLSPKVTEYRGQVKFVLCAVGPDLKLKWHTTQGTGQVMEGLEPDNSHAESQTADVVAQLIAMVEEQTSAVEKVGADKVAEVKAATRAAQDGAVTTIETAGAAVKASIPTDYTALSDAMRKTAPGIVCSAVGEVITLSDSSNQAFRGMRIFGRSTQDGVPTPDNPVEIVSIENPVISVGEQTVSIPRALHGIPVTSGGNYTDENGQQWICDEVDFARCMYIKRIGKKVFDGTEDPWWQTSDQRMFRVSWNGVSGGWEQNKSIASHFNYNHDKAYGAEAGYFAIDQKGLCYFACDIATLADFKSWISANNVTVICPLATPIETPLSEPELAAYRALHTNKPNTTILNDSGAYMSVDYTADTKLYIDNKIKEALLC